MRAPFFISIALYLTQAWPFVIVFAHTVLIASHTSPMQA